MPNANTEKKLAAVHPELVRRVRGMLAQLQAQGHEFIVTDGLRTFDEQSALYAQGRTKPGKVVTNAKAGYSNHNFGLACDLWPIENGKINWNPPDAIWKLVGKAADAQGLEWGGRWTSFVDRPHVQLPGLSMADCRRLYQQGGIPNVWRKASEIVAVVAAPVVRPVPAQTVTITSPPAPIAQPVQTIVTPMPAPKVEVKQATPEKVSLFNSLKGIVGLRVLQLLSGGSLTSAAFWTQYKWPLLCVGAFITGYVIAWQLRPPKEKQV